MASRERSVLERLARPVIRSPRVRYAVRGAQLRLRALAGRRTGAVSAALRADVDRFGSLFEASERNFDELVRPWRAEFTWSVGRVNNGAFESVDAELYHSVLRTYRPEHVIEVGGGNSSWFSRDALRLNGSGEVMVIDPQPRVRLPRGVASLRLRVENVDPASFAELRANDVLFIDSSHTTEEARFHVSEILPRLAPGVLVHHHDVLFPYDRYYLGDRETYGEPDVVLEFYERNSASYEVLVGAAYVLHRARGLLTGLVDSYHWQPGRIPGSLWARKL